MTARASSLSIEYALREYGVRCRLAEALEICRVSEHTFRDGVRQGRYPSPVAHGLYSTEAVARAAVGLYQGDDDDAEDDPFCLSGPVSQDDPSPA